MLLRIHPQTPQEREIATVVEALRKGAVIIYPTDTVYALGCDITNARSIERICKIRGIQPNKATFSIVCSDLSQTSSYARIDNNTFALMRRNLPGAFTFILNGSSNLPRCLKHRKTIGIRIPNNAIAQQIVQQLGNPILSASLIQKTEEKEYFTNPELISETYQHEVDMVIDGGIGGEIASTIVDCTQAEITLVRQGTATLSE